MLYFSIIYVDCETSGGGSDDGGGDTGSNPGSGWVPIPGSGNHPNDDPLSGGGGETGGTGATEPSLPLAGTVTPCSKLKA